MCRRGGVISGHAGSPAASTSGRGLRSSHSARPVRPENSPSGERQRRPRGQRPVLSRPLDIRSRGPHSPVTARQLGLVVPRVRRSVAKRAVSTPCPRGGRRPPWSWRRPTWWTDGRRHEGRERWKPDQVLRPWAPGRAWSRLHAIGPPRCSTPRITMTDETPPPAKRSRKRNPRGRCAAGLEEHSGVEQEPAPPRPRCRGAASSRSRHRPPRPSRPTARPPRRGGGTRARTGGDHRQPAPGAGRHRGSHRGRGRGPAGRHRPPRCGRGLRPVGRRRCRAGRADRRRVRVRGCGDGRRAARHPGVREQRRRPARPPWSRRSRGRSSPGT